MLGLSLLERKEYAGGVKELQRVWILVYSKLCVLRLLVDMIFFYAIALTPE